MNENAKPRTRNTVGYVECAEGQLQGRNGRPFFRVRLDVSQTRVLLKYLDRCAASRNREWFTLTSTHDKPERLKLTRKRPPDYEVRAAPLYVRGDPIHISGNEGSCNIAFSGEFGGKMLADRLRTAQERMRRFVDMVVPNRKRQLIVFLPDVDLEAGISDEHQRLGQAGAALSATIWSSEDFADWESSDG